MADEQDSTEVLILTSTFSIQGRIGLLPGVRLTDYIRQSGDFIAVSNATVAELKGKELFQSAFLDISKNHIEIISPMKMVAKTIEYKNR